MQSIFSAAKETLLGKVGTLEQIGKAPLDQAVLAGQAITADLEGKVKSDITSLSIDTVPVSPAFLDSYLLRAQDHEGDQGP